MAETLEGALLWVFSDPGEKVTLEEFHDWYDNEHIPLRMDNNLPEFLTGARYESLIPQPPKWMAIYEVSSSSFFNDPKYTTLRANRSSREAALVKNLGILDRRICGVKLADTGSVRDTKGPAPFLVIAALTPAQGTDADFEKWYKEEHIGMMAKIPGWRRTFRYKITDSLLSQTGKEDESGKAPQYVAIYEFEHLDPETFPKDEAFQQAISTDWAKKTMGSLQAREMGFWKLYKDWPNTSKK
ncbi:hypothetical protein BT69DRAFT_1241783 [Atractiella rhizophila]|nr:hypothetical protein BT69DRAFT_1241783 [Atractiella rhizophila]